MKLYDFLCDDCGNKFEDLVRELSDARCPTCESANVTKQLSTFAIGAAAAAAPRPPSAAVARPAFAALAAAA